MIKPAIKTTLYEEILNQIIDIIKQGEEWMPGNRIPGEVELANKFEVSRNCVREALKALELLGIVKSKPGRGTYVTDEAIRNIRNSELLRLLNDESSLAELMEIRQIVEVQMAYLAAERAGTADKEKLSSILQKLKECVYTKSDWTKDGFEFHMTIARITRNRILIRLLESITNELMTQRNRLILDELDEIEMIKDHEEIFEGIKKGQPEKARDAMYKHLVRTLDTLFEKGLSSRAL